MLTETAAPIPIAHLASQAGLDLSGLRRSVAKLDRIGIVESSRGRSPRLIQLSRIHPLADSIRTLFGAERSKFQGIVGRLREAAQAVQPRPSAIWIEGAVALDLDYAGDALEVALLTWPRDREIIGAEMTRLLDEAQRDLNIPVRLRVYTADDLATLSVEVTSQLRRAIPLLGLPPHVFAVTAKRRATTVSASRSASPPASP